MFSSPTTPVQGILLLFCQGNPTELVPLPLGIGGECLDFPLGVIILRHLTVLVFLETYINSTSKSENGFFCNFGSLGH